MGVRNPAHILGGHNSTHNRYYCLCIREREMGGKQMEVELGDAVQLALYFTENKETLMAFTQRSSFI